MAIGTPTSIGTNSSSSATTNVTTTGAVPAGALVIMLIGVGLSSGTSTITASGGGLTWTTDHSQLFSGAIPWYYAIASAQAPSGLASGSTLTGSGTGTTIATLVAVAYCEGLETSGVKDVSDGNGQGTGTTWDTTATSTTVADTLVIGGCLVDGTKTNTPSGGATELNDFQYATEAWSMCVEYLIKNTASSASLTGTWSSPGNTDKTSAFVAYKGAAGAAPTSLPPVQPYRSVYSR